MNTFLAEMVGTALLILLGNGVVAGVVLKNTKAEGAGWIVITFGWALAVTFGVYSVGSISGAHLNPAVTLGLAATGSFPSGYKEISAESAIGVKPIELFPGFALFQRLDRTR